MPPRRNKRTPPPEVMTWGKAKWVLILCVIVDALRAFFNFFWISGPATLALLCALGLTETLSAWTFGLLGGKTAMALCTSGSIAASVAGAAFTVPFGVVMAMAVGLLGWGTVGLILWRTNERIFKENALWMGASLLTSEVPLLNTLPALTLFVGKMYRTQIRVEQEAYKKWEQENAAAERAEREQQAALMRARQEQEAANDAVYAQAANDEEIPEQAQEAA